MNFKFNINEKAYLLEVSVSIPKRKNGLSERVRVNTRKVKDLVKNNFDCPKNLIIGECISPGISLDNDFDKCEATWQFTLLRISSLPSPIVKKSKTTTAKSPSTKTRKKVK